MQFNEKLPFRALLGGLSMIMATVGCHSYPAELVGPQPIIAAQVKDVPAAASSVEQKSSLADDSEDEFSYSEGAPVAEIESLGAHGVSSSRLMSYFIEPPGGLGDCIKGYELQATNDQAVPQWSGNYCTWVNEPASTPMPTTSSAPSPTPSPTFSLPPSLVKPSTKPQGKDVFWFRVTHFFSPNSDGVKDTARIDVVSSYDQGVWVLRIKDIGEVAVGSGPLLNYTWDGTVNGTHLPDGRYTLQLTRISTGQTVSAGAVIDNGQPKISDLKMEQDLADPTGNTFTFTGKVEDVGLSGLDLSKLKVEIKGTSVTGTVNPFSPKSGRISQKFIIAPEPGQIITADVTAIDKAGNSIAKNSGSGDEQRLVELSERFGAAQAQLTDRMVASTTCSADPNAYGLLEAQEKLVDWTAMRDAESAIALAVAMDENVNEKDRIAAFVYWADLNTFVITSTDDILLIIAGQKLGRIVAQGSIIVVRLGSKSFAKLWEKSCSYFIRNSDGTLNFQFAARRGSINFGGIPPSNIPAIWSKIKATQPLYPGTEIPLSFEIDLGSQKMWVHPNASEHIYDEVAKVMKQTGIKPKYYTQLLLEDFAGALRQATKDGVVYEKMMNVGHWELQFGAPREPGLLPAVKHSVFKGWGGQ